jgi:hypothetical protein
MRAGLRTMAFFCGHQVMHVIDILLQPAIFMSVYYTLTLPEIAFLDYYTSARPPCIHLPCWQHRLTEGTWDRDKSMGGTRLESFLSCCMSWRSNDSHVKREWRVQSRWAWCGTPAGWAT